MQTLLRETDIDGYDIQGVMAHLRAVQASAIVINGGGVIDFFRHEHPMAKPSAYLKNRDVLAELTSACRAAGIRVLARVDFRGVEETRFLRQPDWFALGADGQPLRTEGGYRRTCFNGGYRNDYGLHLIRELFTRYRVDGIWYNAVQAPGACYCGECARKYRAATGADIPRIPDAADAFLGPEMARYRELKARWAMEHLTRVRETIKSFGPEGVLSVEIFGMYASRPGDYGGIDVATVSPVVDFLLAKVFVDDADPPASAGSAIRFLHALDCEKPAVLLTSTHRNKFRLVAEDPVDVQTAIWEAVAAGGGIWNALVAGSNPDQFADRRNARLTEPAFHFLARHGRQFAEARPVGEAKILFSLATRQRFSAGFRDSVEGAERVLAEHHVAHTFLLSDQLGPRGLANVRVLVLPNVAALSDIEASAIRDFVAAGGTLVADFQTSLFDEQGRRRRDFALADVFGVSCTKDAVMFDSTSARNSPIALRGSHDLLRRHEGTSLLLNGGRMVRCVAQGAEVLGVRLPQCCPTINR